jgi:hypothetical protein
MHLINLLKNNASASTKKRKENVSFHPMNDNDDNAM